ncbi:MAG TPA: hypothetical protein VE998_13005, partial [Terriglobales bacterium]|nr:hypothetical protein [Terriglobales bacterium]
DVLFREPALPAEVLERALKFFCEIFKHELSRRPLAKRPLAAMKIRCSRAAAGAISRIARAIASHASPSEQAR